MGIFGPSNKRSHEAAAVITGAGSGIGATYSAACVIRAPRASISLPVSSSSVKAVQLSVDRRRQ